jgi:tripartite-type tricarboxylate transporter receptor subunit TctC
VQAAVEAGAPSGSVFADSRCAAAPSIRETPCKAGTALRGTIPPQVVGVNPSQDAAQMRSAQHLPEISFMNFVRRALMLGCAAALGSAGLTAHAADPYPNKPVTMVVPFSAGGPTDNVARALAESMRKSLGQQIVVENVGGAGGTVGTNRVAKAQPDGYSVLLMHIGFSTAPSLYRKLAYNPETDFEPIGLVVEVPMTIVARSDFAPANFKDFVAHLKANKDKLNFANAGIGSASHLCGLMFMSSIQADIQTVPFKGTADAMTALVGKQVDLMCDQTTNTTEQIRANRIKAYAVTSSARVETLSSIPTTAESGFPNVQVGVWHGVWVPKGTPKPVIDKLVAAVNDGMKDPAFRDRMAKLGATVYPANRATPAALGDHVKKEIARWGPIIKAAGVYAD